MILLGLPQSQAGLNFKLRTPCGQQVRGILNIRRQVCAVCHYPLPHPHCSLPLTD